MNVRITPKGQPKRTNTYMGVVRLELSIGCLTLHYRPEGDGPVATVIDRLFFESFEVDEGGAVS